MGRPPQGAHDAGAPNPTRLRVTADGEPGRPGSPVQSPMSGPGDAGTMLTPRYRWRYPDRTPVAAAFAASVAAHGGSELLARVLARRGLVAADVDAFFGPPAAGFPDPALLPDAEALVERIARARAAGEGILVLGDFDADGLTGLAILVTALRRLGMDVAWHVPSRLEDGHGLSLRAVEAARAAGRTLMVTVDTGSSSVAEVAAARSAGIDVIVTDHHRLPEARPAAVALVNPMRPDCAYPDRRLAGSGVALGVAALVLERLAGIPAGTTAADLADLAAIGTVADVAPVLGANRSIARLGLERIREGSRPGIAALLAAAGIEPGAATLETIAFAIAPRPPSSGPTASAGT